MSASSDSGDLQAKVALNIITELFRRSLSSLAEAAAWVKERHDEYDPFALAANRYKQRLEKRYNVMSVLGMREPIPLRSIYTRVNILENVTALQRITIEQLEKAFHRDTRNLGNARETANGIEVVNQIDKLVILGKPGAGKTTFLRYITLQASEGMLEHNKIPILVELKRLADSDKSLFDFIVGQFDICGFPAAALFINRMLESGNCMLLFDGLDEVSQVKEDLIVNQVKDFTDKYNDNQFILSCRVAAYKFSFDKFTIVEMADFNDRQIKTFIDAWFGANIEKARLCWQELEEHKPIKDLAATPLLLTLLCLAFDKTMNFPANRGELYEEAIDALLKEWDTSRSIKRDEIYKNLSLKKKESLYSRIAASSFEKDQYFIPQRVIEKHIEIFISNLTGMKDGEIERDSKDILRSMEAQHGIMVERARGIYSFSHLTFQEYFTAKYIVDNVNRGTLESLIKNHLLDYKWREVFLITAGMLEEADDFLMKIKEQGDRYVTRDTLRFLNYLKVKAKIDEMLKPIFGSRLHQYPLLARSIIYFIAQVVCNNEKPKVSVFISPDKHERFHHSIYSAIGFKFGIVGSLAEERKTLNFLTVIKTKDLISFQYLNSQEVAEIFHKNYYADVIEHKPKQTIAISEIPHSLELLHYNYYAHSEIAELLYHCLKTDCYVSKATRSRILSELLPVKI